MNALSTLATTTATARTSQYWLMKSEPNESSIDDALAAPDATAATGFPSPPCWRPSGHSSTGS